MLCAPKTANWTTANFAFNFLWTNQFCRIKNHFPGNGRSAQISVRYEFGSLGHHMIARTAKATDAPRIAHIHVETWRTAYRGQIPDAVLDALDVNRRTAFWHEQITQARGSIFVAEDDNVVVGFCDLIPSRGKRCGFTNCC